MERIKGNTEVNKRLLNEILDNESININEFGILGGGKNSETYWAKTENNNKCVIKIYPEKDGSHDRRMRHSREENFLEYCKFSIVENTPRILAKDKNRKWIVLSWLKGKKIKEIDDKYINSLIAFLEKLNEKNPTKGNMYRYKAKDNYINTDKTIEENLKRYNIIMKQSQIDKEIRFWIESEIKQKIEMTLNDQYDETDESRLILSPSDVGIQNSLRMEDKFMYFDFEYGGIDDIHKTISDIILQPNHKLNEYQLRIIFDEIRSKKCIGSKISNKVICKLFNLYQIRWTLIIAKHVNSIEELINYDQRTRDIIVKSNNYLN